MPFVALYVFCLIMNGRCTQFVVAHGLRVLIIVQEIAVGSESLVLLNGTMSK
jgi:hypothetical protein